jgi:hypothetical protein
MTTQTLFKNQIACVLPEWQVKEAPKVCGYWLDEEELAEEMSEVVPVRLSQRFDAPQVESNTFEKVYQWFFS